MLEAALQDDLMGAGASSSSAGASRKVAAIVIQMDSNQIEEILQSVAETEPAIDEDLKGMLFTFEDIPSLSLARAPFLLDQVPTDRLIVALRGANESLRSAILTSLSARMRRMVEAELTAGDPPPRREIIKAHRAIAETVLKLSEAGFVDCVKRRVKRKAIVDVRERRRRLQNRRADRKENWRRSRAGSDWRFRRRFRTFAGFPGPISLPLFHYRASTGVLSGTLALLLENAGTVRISTGEDSTRFFAYIGGEALSFLGPFPGDYRGLGIAGVLRFRRAARRLRQDHARPGPHLSIKGWKRLVGVGGWSSLANRPPRSRFLPVASPFP